MFVALKRAVNVNVNNNSQFRHVLGFSGREPSDEHFWQVWLKSVQRFQRRRVKCEKLTDAYP
jgi:hypothetical protein